MWSRQNSLKTAGKSAGVLAAISVFSLVLLSASGSAHAAQAASYYTPKQAAEGAGLYSAHCSECHGANLAGQAGPALAGPAFKSSLQFSKMTAAQLFDFVSQQMPANAPGSLSKTDYLNLIAYILHKNGYPAGNKPLSPKRVAKLKLLPYPTGGAGHTSSHQ